MCKTRWAILLVVLFSFVLFNTSFPKPDNQNRPVIIIVHGAWGGSWAFRQVDSLLTEKGFNVYRPSLTGLGERVHLASSEITISTHVNDVVNTILFEDLHDIILVGHSYGGMVITGVADIVPDRIKKLIYLDAFLPSDNESVFSIQGERSEWLKKNISGDYIIPFWVRPEQKLPKDVPHPLKTFSEPISLKNALSRQVPGLYILTVDPGKEAKDDDFASQAERAKQRGWTVLELSSDHNPQWSAPKELAELLNNNK